MSEPIKGGGQAFPMHERDDALRGMSLRDWFAGQALAGLCAQSSDAVLTVMGNDALRRGEKTTWETFARESYAYADAMIAQREKRP